MSHIHSKVPTTFYSLLLSGFLFATGISAQEKAPLLISGNLTQGVAISNNYQIYGIPTEINSNFRQLALQFRYDISLQNHFVVQLSHRKSGLNPIVQEEPDIDLDWGYFTYQFNQQWLATLGKLPIPIGIYNTERDLGLQRPFFQVPTAFYHDDMKLSETLDGFLISYSGDTESSWSLAIHLFGGFWKYSQFQNSFNPLESTIESEIFTFQVINGFGSQLWLNTPFSGLRLGGGLLSGDEETASGGRRFYNSSFSIDGVFSRFTLRQETIYSMVDGGTPNQLGTYALGEIKLLPNLAVNLIFEKQWFENADMSSSSSFTSQHQDLGFGATMTFSGKFLVRGEYHLSEGYRVEDIVANPVFDLPFQTNYFIISVSAGF